MSRRMLNIGCGSRFHPDWVNVDLFPSSPKVRAMDIGKGLEFPDGSFDVVYHSHVLEHVPAERASALLGECGRVLAKNGVMRVVVPDLEQIARAYLKTVDEVITGAPGAEDRHAWMTLEMLDQMTRNRSGGRVAQIVSTASPELKRFAWERWGVEAERLWKIPSKKGSNGRGLSLGQMRSRIVGGLQSRALRLLLGTSFPAYQNGLFRSRGEIHQWMYDRVSLKGLLVQAGLVDVACASARSSLVEGWEAFHLDTEPDGTVYKPDSLFMEGRKRANEGEPPH